MLGWEWETTHYLVNGQLYVEKRRSIAFRGFPMFHVVQLDLRFNPISLDAAWRC